MASSKTPDPTAGSTQSSGDSSSSPPSSPQTSARGASAPANSSRDVTLTEDTNGCIRFEGPNVDAVDRGLAFRCVSDAAAAAKSLSYTFDPLKAPRKTGTDAVLRAQRNPPKPVVLADVVEAD